MNRIGIHININTYRRFLVLVLSAIMIVSCLIFHADIVSEAKSGTSNSETSKAGQDETEAVEKFMTAFYQAHTKEGLDSLQDYVEDIESLPLYIIRYETMLAYGFQKWDNIDVDAYSLSLDGYWLAFVYSDMVVEDSDIKLPGAKGYLVHKGEDGKFRVIIEEQEDAISDEAYEKLQQEIREISLTDEVVDKVTECTVKYNDICAKNPEVVEWFYDVYYAVDQAIAEAISEEAAEKDETGGKADGRDAEDKVYTVQKGDCLWDIAEKQLGDGMYWGRIYEKNKNVIGDNPDLLFVGIQLQINE